MSEAEEVFADLNHPRPQGRCHRCLKATRVEERVMIRVLASATDKGTGTSKVKALTSWSRTFCADCGRTTFDDCKDQIENGKGD